MRSLYKGEEVIGIIVFLILCILVLVYLQIQQRAYLKIDRSLDELAQEKIQLEQKNKELNTENSDLELKNENLKKASQEQQERLDKQIESLSQLSSQYEETKRLAEEQCAHYQETAASRLRELDSQCQKTIEEKETATKEILAQLDSQLADAREKYLSILETISIAESEEDKNVNRHIILKDVAKFDIDYLLNNVSPHLSNPDILYKLIWSEYIQSPTNTMLDYILPNRDCAGIYKITNDQNKKAYIGRSTSVRKRLTDHIKSAIGISTIADQKVHEVMREEGIWNFTFELIEACDRDKLNEREKYYISFFATEQNGYNQKAGG